MLKLHHAKLSNYGALGGVLNHGFATFVEKKMLFLFVRGFFCQRKHFCKKVD